MSGLFRKKMEKEGMMVVDIKNIVTRLPELRFTAPVNWRIDEGQQWAVVGPNGAGKTLIADIMQRKFAFKELRYISKCWMDMTYCSAGFCPRK